MVTKVVWQQHLDVILSLTNLLFRLSHRHRIKNLEKKKERLSSYMPPFKTSTLTRQKKHLTNKYNYLNEKKLEKISIYSSDNFIL